MKFEEIERKFLVKDDTWEAIATSSFEISQGYLLSSADRSIRVRIRDEQALMTVKHGKNPLSRTEVEFGMPLAAASELLAGIDDHQIIRKRRHLLHAEDGMLWEIDVFHGSLTGLVIAEVELISSDQELSIPDWVGVEVTGNPSFLNENLRFLSFDDIAKEI